MRELDNINLNQLQANMHKYFFLNIHKTMSMLNRLMNKLWTQF